MPAVRVYGDPIPKGSMVCVGQRGPRKHVVIDSQQKALEPWQDKIAAAGAALLARLGQPLAGPLTISITFTVPRPASVPLAKRAMPIVRSAGDIDKLERAVLDGLTTGGLFADDSVICHAETWKCYPDSPGIPDRMDRPGALIRIEPMS